MTTLEALPRRGKTMPPSFILAGEKTAFARFFLASIGLVQIRPFSGFECYWFTSSAAEGGVSGSLAGFRAGSA